MRIAPIVVVLSLLFAADKAAAVVPSFTGLGDLPGGGVGSWADGISADGSTIVGSSSAEADTLAFRWTQGTGIVSLGKSSSGYYSYALAASSDGSVIVGTADSGSSWYPTRWTASTGWVSLGAVGDTYMPRAEGVSANGSVIVGWGSRSSAPYSKAFRWTQTGGMQVFAFDGRAYACSNDGNVMVGLYTSSNGTEAFRWTSAGGIQGLGDLPGGTFGSKAYDVSGNSSVVVGEGTTASGARAFRWSEGQGMEALGPIVDGGDTYTANGVSEDGSVLVGRGGNNTGDIAFIWDSVHGARDLRQLLIDGGATNLAGWSLRYATDISADGQVVIGYGVNPSGVWEGWRVVVPEPFTLSLLALGGLALLRRKGYAGQAVMRLRKRTTRH